MTSNHKKAVVVVCPENTQIGIDLIEILSGLKYVPYFLSSDNLSVTLHLCGNIGENNIFVSLGGFIGSKNLINFFKYLKYFDYDTHIVFVVDKKIVEIKGIYREAFILMEDAVNKSINIHEILANNSIVLVKDYILSFIKTKVNIDYSILVIDSNFETGFTTQQITDLLSLTTNVFIKVVSHKSLSDVQAYFEEWKAYKTT